MSEALTVPTESAVQPPEHKMLVALSPQEVPAAQQQLKAWCEQKIASLVEQAKELCESIAIAEKQRWQRSTLKKHLKLNEDEQTYYRKILAAVEEGYLIVPNFDVEIMAVRVSEGAVPPESRARWRPTGLQRADPELLPVGEGEYVNPAPVAVRRSVPEPNEQNPKNRESYYFNTDEFRDMQFPVVGVKPIILDATALALSRKVFDSIGVVTGRKQDPVVIGTIYNPRDRYRNKRVSFFIAWWFSTDSL